MNVGKMLEESAKKYGDKTAFIFADEKISFSGTDRLVNNLANELKQRGITQGDCVSIFMSDSLEYPLVYFATLKIGAICVPLDIRLKKEELKAIFLDSQASTIFIDSQFKDLFESIKSEFPFLKNIISKETELQEILKKDSQRIPPAEVKEDDVALYCYTSGTTGKPKGVMLTFSNLNCFPNDMANVFEINENDTWLLTIPASHISGPIVFNMGITIGKTTAILGTFHPKKWLETVEKHQITGTHMVPPLANALLHLDEFHLHDLSRFKKVVLMGAYSSPALVKKFGEKFGLDRAYQGYGLTETSPLITLEPFGKSIGKPGTIGPVVPGVEVKIVDDTGKEVSVGEIGEIITRGPHIMKGYHNEPDATAERIKNSWLYTGDLAKMDENGYFYIVGRKQDRINVGGLMVYVSEVENALHKHPKIKEQAVIGLPDERHGEKVCAFVVPKEGENLTPEEIITYCRKNLANFKVPHFVEIREHLPKTGTGKISKSELKKN